MRHSYIFVKISGIYTYFLIDPIFQLLMKYFLINRQQSFLFQIIDYLVQNRESDFVIGRELIHEILFPR